MFVSFSGGGRRPDSILIPILSLILGIPLILFPGMTGRIFCLVLALGAFVYGAARLIRYARGRRQGWRDGGDKFTGILFLLIGLFCLLGWRIILSFLPLTLGVILLLDGLTKLPLAIDAFQMRLPARGPLLASTVLPLVLGLVMLINPFGVTSLVIRFFGISLMVDGACALAAAISSPRQNPGERWNKRPRYY